jgi:uncharacterized membrane protein YbaN (DUF454 family)
VSPRRAGWLVAGLVCVALGGVGIIVPGLPTTVFFIVAAWCFSKSNPRLEQWVLNLKGVGPMVRDHRAGLGMARRAKVFATSCIVAFSGFAVWFALEHPAARGGVGALALVGVTYIWWRVPTREVVLAQRGVA